MKNNYVGRINSNLVKANKLKLAGRAGTPRTGMALWVVFCIVIVLSIFLGAFVTNRVEMKQQTKRSFLSLRGQWIAQGAIQHALLKFRILPTESYDASALSRGICPFFVASGAMSGSGSVEMAPLEAFRIDIDTAQFPLSAEFDGLDGYSYTVSEMKALNSFTKDNLRKHVVRIIAQGTYEGSIAGKEMIFTDELTKTVDVSRAVSGP